MTPIKLDDFLRQTAQKVDEKSIMDLSDFGMFHAAPREDGKLILNMRFDAETGALVPVMH
ncbi:MAG: hypothetical protein AAF429_03150 [Pseudomonadota bacterium]